MLSKVKLGILYWSTLVFITAGSAIALTGAALHKYSLLNQKFKALDLDLEINNVSSFEGFNKPDKSFLSLFPKADQTLLFKKPPLIKEHTNWFQKRNIFSDENKKDLFLGFFSINLEKQETEKEDWKVKGRISLSLKNSCEGWNWTGAITTEDNKPNLIFYRWRETRLIKQNNCWIPTNAQDGFIGIKTDNFSKAIFPNSWNNIDFPAERKCKDNCSSIQKTQIIKWTGMWQEGDGEQSFKSIGNKNFDEIIFSFGRPEAKYLTTVSVFQKEKWFAIGEYLRRKGVNLDWNWNNNRKGKWKTIDDYCSNASIRTQSKDLILGFCSVS